MMKNIVAIRRAKKSDAKDVRLLLDQLGYPDFSVHDVKEKINIHKQPGYHMMVAETKSQTIGFIALHWFELAHWKGKMGRITSFCMDKKFRSRGLGLQLLKAAEKLLLNKKCIKIEVTSNAKRLRAHGFYLKSGYVEDSKRFVKYRT